MTQITMRGRWAALMAAFLGWLFDGFEMGLFPVIARPALLDLLGAAGLSPVPPEVESQVGLWNSLATAAFLVGAATGGVLFGWIGDRLGRVRAMALSILTYALFSGLGALVTQPWHIVVIRFVAALGMGGEWALGVALVMEVWQGASRAVLAGLIGAAANIGFALVAMLSLMLTNISSGLADGLLQMGLSQSWVDHLTANSAWRMLMVAGMLPAGLTFLIRLFVPESGSWLEERNRGKTSAWAMRDLVGVLIGAAACAIILWLWSGTFGWHIYHLMDGLLGINNEWLHSSAFTIRARLIGTPLMFVVVAAGYLYPIMRYLRRSGASGQESRKIIGRMWLAAMLGGIALLGTWGSIQWAPTWAHELKGGARGVREWTQFWSAMGAIVSCIIAPLIGDWLGRRITYALLCVAALGSTLLFYLTNTAFSIYFLFTVFLAGGATATFYGWLPLYLPELFPTRVRATGQGFGYNFGRILAAIGALQTGALMGWFSTLNVPTTAGETTSAYPLACSIMSMIYLVGMVLIWFAPETKGQPLPE